MSRLETWKHILEGGGFITINEAGTLLIGDDHRVYQVREALNKMLEPGDDVSYSYFEILGMIDDVVVRLPSGTYIGILDLIESDAVKKRVNEIITIVADVLYMEKWLG